MKPLFRPIDPAWGVLLGLFFMTALHLLNDRFASLLQEMRGQQSSEQSLLDSARQAREHVMMINSLKHSDVAHYKADFKGTALSQKSLYESGLSLQEERRLLDKQLEIMTTHLQISPALQRVFLFRGAQPLQSVLMSYFPLKAFGGMPEHLPMVVRVISKERFAAPERGISQMVNGQLVYLPPQVGTSVRSNALGEYVMFTTSGLIIHGPPVNEEDHAKFPHVCLGLSRDAAKKLYNSTFIGNRIVLSPPTEDSQ